MAEDMYIGPGDVPNALPPEVQAQKDAAKGFVPSPLMPKKA
jgi:hypothetical protein